VLGRPKWEEIKADGKTEKRGIHTWQVGTVAAKHWLFRRLGADADLEREQRLVHFSDQLDKPFFAGLLAETFDPRTNRYVKKRGARNEPLDCFDEETEVLTRDGWKPFKVVTGNDLLATVSLTTDQLEYQAPLALIDKPYVGEMVEIKGARIDILVTPNHRMVTLKKEIRTGADGKRKWTFDVAPQITLAKDLTVHHSIKLRATWAGDGCTTHVVPAAISVQGYEISPEVTVDAGDLAELLGWWIAEGSIQAVDMGNGSIQRRVQIAQVKPAGVSALETLLARLPWKWRRAGICFVATSKQLFDLVQPLGRYQHERRVPQWIKDATPVVIERFLAGAIAGDGWVQQKEAHHRKSRAYATTSPGLADDMQELFIKIGNAATMRVVEPQDKHVGERRIKTMRTQYHVYERLASRASLDGGGAGKRGYFGRTVHYEGRVYCATVPNGTLVVRRGGKTFIAGNCYVYAYAAAHHPELRLHRMTQAEWAAAEARVLEGTGRRLPDDPAVPVADASTPPQPPPVRRRTSKSTYLG
jgi:hypothetical protein